MPPRSDELVLDVGPVAHGGHCVARADGRVVFVRHTLPGERVIAQVTDGAPDAGFWRADAIEVLQASPDRVNSAWPAAGPGGVGGGELAHVSPDGQLRWKAAVIAEQLSRLAKVDRDVTVQPAPGDAGRGGLGYRTRISLIADAAGRAGMRKFRSHDVVALDSMPLASADVLALAARERVFTAQWHPGTRLELIAPALGAPILLAGGTPWRGGRTDKRDNARRTVTERVMFGDQELRYKVAADGFWQVHRDAPQLLVDTVIGAVRQALGGDAAGATVLDLYCGSGLFSVPLARAVGPDGRVVCVEGDQRAIRDARRNLHDAPQAQLYHGDVATVLGSLAGTRADVVVLDPPRAGAGRRVVERIAAAKPQAVVYVACDPAALARDVSYFASAGYMLGTLQAFDLFPMTHHVECVAVLEAQ